MIAAAFVHGLVAGGGLVERAARGRRPCRAGSCRFQTRSIRSGRNRRTGAGPPCRWTWEKNSSSPGRATVVGDPDVADVAAGAGGVDGLHHRLLGADRLDHRVRAQPVGQILDRRHAVVAAFGDDVGGAELQRQLLPRLVPAHRDDPFRAELSARPAPRAARPRRRRPRRRSCPARPRRRRRRTSRCPARRRWPGSAAPDPRREPPGSRPGCRRPAAPASAPPAPHRSGRSPHGAGRRAGSRIGRSRRCCRRRRTTRRRTGPASQW